RGMENGLRDVRKLGPEQIKEIEPNAAGIAALHVPEEGIVDYPAVVQKLSDLIRISGGEIRTNARVHRLLSTQNEWTAQTTAGDFTAKFIVTCGGLHSD